MPILPTLIWVVVKIRGYIGILEKKMETTTMGYIGVIRVRYRAIWVFIKIMVLFGILVIIRHLIFEVPNKES